MLGALDLQIVVREAANEVKTRLSGVLTVGERAVCGVLEVFERRVRLEHLGDGNDSICSVGAFVKPIDNTERVVLQAANKGGGKEQPLSGGADSIGKYIRCKAPGPRALPYSSETCHGLMWRG